MVLFIITLITAAVAAVFLGKLAVIFTQMEQIAPDPGQPPETWPKISVIIPARNEEANIRRCVESLAKQTYPADRFELITVDDQSEDRTPEIIAELAQQYSQIKAVNGRPLPKGWFGKSNACARGAEFATGDLLFFLDADTWAEPKMLCAVVAFMEARNIDLLSLNPFQNMVSASERIFLPGIFTAIATAMKFKESNTPGKSFAMASGQYMAFRRTAYEAVGGHEAVGKILEEDMAFANLIKESGYRLYWAFGDKIMNTRMYTDFAGIWEGFSKNLMVIMHCEGLPQALLCAARFLALAWLPPLVLAANLLWTGSGPLELISCWTSILTAAALLIMYLATVITLRVPLLYLFTFPLGFTLHAMMLLQNYKSKKNRQITWKGRTFE